MRPYLQFSVLCDDIGRTGEGKMIIHGVFESIVAPSFPATHRACYVANRWSGGSGTFRERVKVMTPEGDALVLESPETEFTLRSRTACHTVICRLGGLSFEKPGNYTVQVLLDGLVACEYALAVRQGEVVHSPGAPASGSERGGKTPVQD